MIDPFTDEVFPLSETGRHVPVSLRQGKPVSLHAALRWAKKGLRGVRLEVLRIGGRLFTSRQALTRFFQALTHADGGARPKGAEAPQTAHASAVERELDQAGL
jgi:hypothetical protein